MKGGDGMLTIISLLILLIVVTILILLFGLTVTISWPVIMLFALDAMVLGMIFKKCCTEKKRGELK